MSKELKDTLLNINLKNIAEKLKKKKTLTASELALLQQNDDDSKTKSKNKRFVNTVVQLADELGVHRKTIYEWKKINGSPNPTSNGRYEISKWRIFIKKHNLKESENEQIDLKEEKLKIEIEQAKLKLDVLKSNYVSTEHVQDVIFKYIGQARSILENRFLNELPPLLTTLNAIEIREKLQDVLDEAYISIAKSAEIKIQIELDEDE